MRKKRALKLLIILVMAIISNILIIKYCNLGNANITLTYKIVDDYSDTFQLFYSKDGQWNENEVDSQNYKISNEKQKIKFSFPQNIKYLRLDLGSKTSNIKISDVEMSLFGKNVELDLQEVFSNQNEQIENVSIEDNSLDIITNGVDPYCIYEISADTMNKVMQNMLLINKLLKIFLCIIVDILCFFIAKKAYSIYTLMNELNTSKRLIWNLAKNDFKTKYAGSYLGITWAFVQPVVTIVLYWIVFEFGLKAGSPTKNVPYILWLMTGLIPWFFFQESLLNATNCLMEYSYLVKKVVFKVSILPIVKIISALFIHLAFIVFIFLVSSIYKIYPTKYIIQLIYYSFCTFFISLAFSYITSSIIVFFKDLGQIISILLQIGMWATPLMWSYTIVPKKFQWIVKLNPMFYIAEGYRDTFINKIWFIDKYFQTIYFWVIVTVVFIIGTTIFKKLKPHFADVL
ncbi:ABC transporter permease [Clostridium sp. BJN0001]|uniref:ABC transporter permease n=1 Tax=Clostridium sp. BJN0001 TaxID=2930219 RepID=UPI001FD5170A|nr:ABC transporter permease [Clostridium sp. BJN0001]